MTGHMVYLLTNRENGKSYVGQTTRPLSRRWVEHAGSQAETLLARAIRKHGREAFYAERIVSGFPDAAALDAAECFWIGVCGTLAPNGYNLINGGQSGRPHHADTCERLSALGRARYADPEIRQFTALQMAARRANPEMEKRRQDGLRAGVNGSEKHRAAAKQNIAKVNASKPWLKAQAARRIRLVATKDGAEQRFSSSREAAAALGVHESAISMCLTGKRAQAGGFTFTKEN